MRESDEPSLQMLLRRSMKFDPSLPDVARQVLARLEGQVEYTEREPGGLSTLLGRKSQTMTYVI